MAGRLEGKVAIITGAARGQGADEARAFVAEGAKVVITDVLREVNDVAAELGDAAVAVHHDVTDEAQWGAVVQTALDRFGKLDVLVNNAGIFRPGTMLETTKEQFVAHTNYVPIFGGSAEQRASRHDTRTHFLCLGLHDNVLQQLGRAIAQLTTPQVGVTSALLPMTRFGCLQN